MCWFVNEIEKGMERIGDIENKTEKAQKAEFFLYENGDLKTKNSFL